MRRGKRTSLILIILMLLTVFAPYIHSASQTKCPSCGADAIERVIKSSSEVKVACKVYKVNYEQVEISCTKNPKHITTYAKTEVSRSLLREEHTYKTETDTKTENVEKTGCKVYTVSYKRTRSKCSVCGATTSWSGWTETGSTFSNYNHNYVTETDTKTETSQSGCSVYNVSYKHTRSVCSKCGDSTGWSSWTETGRSFSHYDHLDGIENDPDTYTETIGCTVYTVTRNRSRTVCSRCGATGSWSSWRETSRTITGYSHVMVTETDTKKDEIKEGCSVYEVAYARYREKCQYCSNATGSWSAWVEVARNFIKDEHNWTVDKENQYRDEKEGCSVYNVTYTRTRDRCTICNKVGEWSDWIKTGSVFSHYEHALVNDTDSKSEEVKEECSVYRIYYGRIRKKCQHCDYATEWSAWEEVTREFLRDEHSWKTETESQETEVRVGCDIFTVKSERTRERCTACNRVSVWSDWIEISRVFKEKRHNFRTIREENTRELKAGCTVYLVTEERTREECTRCGEYNGDWSPWREIKREILRYEHELVFEGIDHTEDEYEWRGNEYWKIVYAYPRYMCLNCGAIVVGERAVASQELQYRDTTAPAVTITDNYSGDWVGKVNITMTATDTQSGVKTLKYAWSQSATSPGAWTDYQSSLTFATEGEWYFHYQAADLAGNQATGRSGPYKIDKTPPTGTITPSSPTGWIYEVVVDSHDQQSGVKAIYYKWGTVPYTPGPEEWRSWSFTNSPYCRIVPPDNGRKIYLTLVIEDKAGNTAIKGGGAYDVDKEPPVIESLEAQFDNHNHGEQTYNYKVVVDIKATAGDSGLKEVRWHWQKDTETVPPYDEWTVINEKLDDVVKTGKNEPGNWTLHVMAFNNAGLSAYKKTKTYTLYDDSIHVMLTPEDHPAWTRGLRIELEIIREHDRLPGGEHPDPGETLWDPPLIFSWYQVFENGQVSLKKYFHDPACKGQIISPPGNGEWYLEATVQSFSGNINTTTGGPYRIDSTPPYIILEDSYRDNGYSRINLEIEIIEDSPTAREYYIVLAQEDNYNENWEYEAYLLLDSDEGSFWVKKSEVDDNLIFDGSLVAISGKVKKSPYGGAECVWSLTEKPPASGWAPCSTHYTTRKTLTPGDLWYHHVKAWDIAGNVNVRTFGPFITYSSPPPPPPPPPPPDPDKPDSPPPTASLFGPSRVIVGETHEYYFWGTVYTNSGSFVCGSLGGEEFERISNFKVQEEIRFMKKQQITFTKTGQYGYYVNVLDSRGRSAQEIMWVQVVEAVDAGYLTASLAPYYVKHGDSLTVYAHSSVPSPWIEVKGQTIPMNPAGTYWIAEVPVKSNWPLGQNFLTVKNTKKSVELDFIIEEDAPVPDFLDADLTPYYVKHGERLTVYAISSVPSPWVEVKGQTIPMTKSGSYWVAQVSVLPEWPLGQNFLTVKNTKKSVELDFEIVDESADPPRVPRSRIIR